jgi:hypothetical protein
MSPKGTDSGENFNNGSPRYEKNQSSTSVTNARSKARFGIFVPALQTVLFFAALGLRSLRHHNISVLGYSLDNWLMPPECMPLSILVLVLVVQQFRWEAELADST